MRKGSRNDIRLVDPNTDKPGNFRLSEFENRDGLAMVHRSTLASLELVRADLADIVGEDVWVLVTDAVRTQTDLERLAVRLGWLGEGGAVSRKSRHLAEFGGIAVDFTAVIARTSQRLDTQIVGRVCRLYFDWVKDDYGDGHVHADNRFKGQADGF